MTTEGRAKAVHDSDLIAARLERLPIGRWHARVVGLLGGAQFFDAYDAWLIAIILPVLVAEWRLSPQQAAGLLSAGFVGQLFGAPIFGGVAERFGRAFVVRLTLMLVGVSSLACAFSDTFSMMLGFRLLQGIVLGAQVPVSATYLNEICPSSLRGRMVFAMLILYALGSLLVTVASWQLVPLIGWRAMFALGVLPALLALLMKRMLPESPRWLASRGRFHEADAIVNAVEIDMTAKGIELAEPIIRSSTGVVLQQSSFRELFSRQYFPRTILIWAIAFCVSICGFGIAGWMPTLYASYFHLSVETSMRYSSLMSFVGLFGAILPMFLIDRWGRKSVLSLGFIGAGAALVVLWLVALNVSPLIVVVLVSAAYLCISFSLGTVWVYAPELYPTRVRALATGSASAWFRVAAIVGPIVVGSLLNRGSVSNVFLFFGVFGFIGAVVVLMFGIETNGKNLEQLSI